MLTAKRYLAVAEPIDPANPSPSKLTLQVTFANTPSSPLATVPNLKYNKSSWFSFELDDMSESIPLALSILGGKFFTDGCGNNKPYTMSAAVNGAREIDGYEYPMNDAVGDRLRAVIAAGGDLSDHSYYHDPVGFGAGITPLQNTILMQDFIKRKFNGYEVRSKIVPTNYAGHAQAAFEQGYVYSTSQGTFDTFTPEWMYAPPGTYSNIGNPFATLRRDFTDSWAGSIADLKTIINNIIANTGKFFRLGSHFIDDETSARSFFNHIETNASDKLLVSNTREILEYREMKALPMTQSLLGNVLTIEVDMVNLSSKNRWKDLSFIITGGTIQSVTTNATSSSFNPATGLVNIFKQTINGAVIPAEDIIPEGLELKANNIYYAGDSTKYGTSTKALDREAVGTIVDKKGSLNLKYIGDAVPVFTLKPPVLRTLGVDKPYIVFENQPHTSYATNVFGASVGINHAITFVIEYKPGQDYEAFMPGFTESGNKDGGYHATGNYVGNFGDRLRAGTSGADHAMSIVGDLGFMIRRLVHIEFKTSTMDFYIDGVLKNSLAYNPNVGSVNAKIINALGVETNNALWNFFAMYQFYGSNYTNMVSTRTAYFAELITKWNIGQLVPNPHAYNILFTFNNATRNHTVTFNSRNATQQQINNAEYKWVLYGNTLNGDGGNFNNQRVLGTSSVLNESAYSAYTDKNFLTVYVKLGDYDWIRGDTFNF